MKYSRRTALVVLVLLTGCRERSLPHEGKSAAELEAMLRDADPVVQSQGAFGLSLRGPAVQQRGRQFEFLQSSRERSCRVHG